MVHSVLDIYNKYLKNTFFTTLKHLQKITKIKKKGIYQNN